MFLSAACMGATADSADVDVVCLSRDFHRSAFVLLTDIIKFNFLMFCASGSTADYVDHISLMFSFASTYFYIVVRKA